MDTPQSPTADTPSPPARDHVTATADRNDASPAAHAGAVDDGAPSAENGRPDGNVEPVPATASQGVVGAEGHDAAPPQPSYATSIVAGVEDPAEGSADIDDGEGPAKAFDPAAFDEALNHVLSTAGGELLFRFPEDVASGEKVAAVRLGDGEARLIALVILPPHGNPLRVEPVEASENPLAALAKSYASLVDAWKAAA
ncbi:MAG TPA: hypothetical protein GX405_14635 [Rhizobiales bacterium]|nr:hypothetical protein [Hyphomicrobiales bacterium]